MAKLFLRGNKDAVLLDNEKARELKDMWLTGQLGETVDLGEHVFKKADIRAIEGVPAPGEKVDTYDLDSPEDRQTIKEFEKAFLKFAEENPGGLTRERWMYSLGLISKPNEYGWYGVKEEKIAQYQIFQNKWSALQDLRVRRSHAEKLDRESLQGAFQEMK